MPSGFRQDKLLRAAFKQCDAEKVFQHNDVPTDRALGNREAIGGGGKAQMLPRRLKRPEGVQRQPLAIHPSSPRSTSSFHTSSRARRYQSYNATGPLQTIRASELIQRESDLRLSSPPGNGFPRRSSANLQRWLVQIVVKSSEPSRSRSRSCPRRQRLSRALPPNHRSRPEAANRPPGAEQGRWRKSGPRPGGPNLCADPDRFEGLRAVQGD